jgi:hypothetical protein
MWCHSDRHLCTDTNYITAFGLPLKVCQSFRLFDSRLFDFRLFDSRLFDFRLFDSRLFDFRLFDFMLFDFRLFDFMLFDFRLRDSPYDVCTALSIFYFWRTPLLDIITAKSFWLIMSAWSALVIIRRRSIKSA